jgi:tocopherol O-methyltransferase
MLRWGPGRSEGAIHRAVWDPGCRTLADALHAVDRRILDRLVAEAPEHALDLGCGAGSSALWLAERLAVRVTGITLSPLQARLARELAAQRGLQERCRFLEGDFCGPFPADRVQAAYAIESFSHASSPKGFFARMNELLPPGALLLVCDDFLTHAIPAEKEEARWTKRFAAGWRLPSLCTVEEAGSRAGAHGFELVSDEDLTPLLRLTPRAALLFRHLIESSPLLKASVRSSLAGGTALQVCQRRGWTRYRFLAFRRNPA